MANKTVCILGRQPEVGLAELESLFGEKALSRISDGTVIVDVDPQVFPFERLGGSIKAAKLLTTLDFNDWTKITNYLVEHVPKHTCCIPEGKLTFGISTYGLSVKVAEINKTALAVKRVHTKGKDKRPVRVVPNKTHELNAAQVIHNKLTDPLGMELLFVQTNDGVVLAQTFAVQDIEAYTARDQKRPKRDAKVGMLPPKLAQIIVNLGAGNIEQPEEDTEPTTKTVLDPFCGTGVVLQEALLMGYDVFGTDIDLRMVQYSEENLEWLKSRFTVTKESHLTIGDATNFDWREAFDTVACETYLGRPLSHQPTKETLKKITSDVATIHKKFLENLAKQTPKGMRLCIAVPAWKTKDGFVHLSTLDHLEKLGYTRLSFTHAGDKPLIYHRDGQYVGRELVVLTRK